MRLLPRSAKGTWLLAGAVWAAICFWAWTILPVLPRSNLHLPFGSELLGFGPNAEVALVLRTVLRPNEREIDHQKLVLFDVSSSRSTVTLLDRCGSIGVIGQSRDGRTWLLGETDIPKPRLLRFDLPTHSLHPLSVGVPGSAVTRYALSRDGKLCVFDNKSTKSIILWDVNADRQRAELHGLQAPFAIAADGRSLVAFTSDEHQREIAVMDLTTLARRCTIPALKDRFALIWKLDLSADESYIVAVVAGFWGLTAPTQCWNVATKAKCFGEGTDLQGDNGVLIRRNTLVAAAQDDQHEKHLRWFNLDSGATTADVPMAQFAPWSMSPNGRLVELWVGVEQANFFEKTAERIGLRWPFSASGKTGPVFFDAATGRHVGTVPPIWDRVYLLIAAQ